MNARILLAFLTTMALATVAGAQTKLSGTAQCAKPDPQNLVQVGDRPNHSLMISQSKCTWSKPLEIEGVKNKEGVSTWMDDASGNRSRTRGYYVDTMANGDNAYVSYQGTTTLKDGAPQTLEGKWTYTGGTGKLKGLKGQGTYKGKANADGSVTYEIEGEYTLPK